MKISKITDYAALKVYVVLDRNSIHINGVMIKKSNCFKYQPWP